MIGLNMAEILANSLSLCQVDNYQMFHKKLPLQVRLALICPGASRTEHL